MKHKNLQKITDLRHELHMYPELSMQETETAARLRKFLEDNTGFQVVDRGNWFYAVHKVKGAKNKIAFRADMDALPITEDHALSYHSRNEGVSHKCGHDGHCAALCGLALELDGKENDALELDRKEKDTDSDIYLIFQPGEETGSGAVICRELIRQEGIAQIYAFHNLGGYPEGSIIYRTGLTQPASEGLRICFEGKTSHASAPEEGRNPSGAVARVILKAEELTRDQSDGMFLCTITGVSVGTGDFGISPGSGELSMTIRAEKETRMKEIEEQIIRFAQEEAARCQLQTSFSIHDYFPETRNHERALQKVRKCAENRGFETCEMQDLWRASEDFGYYLKKCEGAMFYIGNGESYPALHTAEYDFNDRILDTAVDMFVSLAASEL